MLIQIHPSDLITSESTQHRIFLTMSGWLLHPKTWGDSKLLPKGPILMEQTAFSLSSPAAELVACRVVSRVFNLPVPWVFSPVKRIQQIRLSWGLNGLRFIKYLAQCWGFIVVDVVIIVVISDVIMVILTSILFFWKHLGFGILINLLIWDWLVGLNTCNSKLGLPWLGNS